MSSIPHVDCRRSLSRKRTFPIPALSQDFALAADTWLRAHKRTLPTQSKSENAQTRELAFGSFDLRGQKLL